MNGPAAGMALTVQKLVAGFHGRTPGAKLHFSVRLARGSTEFGILDDKTA